MAIARQEVAEGTQLTTGVLSPADHSGLRVYSITGLTGNRADLDEANDDLITNLPATHPDNDKLPLIAVTSRYVRPGVTRSSASYRRHPDLVKPTKHAWQLARRRSGQAVIDYWATDDVISNGRPGGFMILPSEQPLAWIVPTITFSVPALVSTSPDTAVNDLMRKMNNAQVKLSELGNVASATGAGDFTFPARTLYFAGYTEDPAELIDGSLFRVWYHLVYTKAPGWVTTRTFTGPTIVLNHPLYEQATFAAAFPVHTP